MKLPDFESPPSDSSSKSANFGLSKWIFYVKNHTNLSKKNHWCPIFDELSLDGDPKFDNFIQLQLILGQKPCLGRVPDHEIPLP